jgi:hypothetical protein
VKLEPEDEFFVMAGRHTAVGMSPGSSQGIYFWHYPKGGEPYKTFPLRGFSEPIGLAISPAPKL